MQIRFLFKKWEIEVGAGIRSQDLWALVPHSAANLVYGDTGQDTLPHYVSLCTSVEEG